MNLLKAFQNQRVQILQSYWIRNLIGAAPRDLKNRSELLLPVYPPNICLVNNSLLKNQHHYTGYFLKLARAILSFLKSYQQIFVISCNIFHNKLQERNIYLYVLHTCTFIRNVSVTCSNYIFLQHTLFLRKNSTYSAFWRFAYFGMNC